MGRVGKLRMFLKRALRRHDPVEAGAETDVAGAAVALRQHLKPDGVLDRKSTRLNSSHRCISYAVFCLKKKRSNRKPARLSTTEMQQREPRQRVLTLAGPSASASARRRGHAFPDAVARPDTPSPPATVL